MSGPTTTAARPSGLHRAEWKCLVGLWFVVTLSRWWFASNRAVFHLYPDEAAQLAIGRNLAGRTPWSLYDHSTWQPGLGLLLVPISSVASRSETVFKFGLGLNAVIGGLSAVVLAAILRRTAETPSHVAAAIAGGTALMPSAMSASAHVWAEPLVTLTFLLALLGCMGFVAAPSVARAAAVVVASSTGYLVHARLLPLVLTTTAVLCVVFVRERQWRSALLSATGSLGSVLLVAWTSSSIVARTWTAPDSTNTAMQTLRRLGEPVGVLEAAVGQSWYQLVASAGIAGLGFGVLVWRASGIPVRFVAMSRPDAVIILLLTLPLVATSVVFVAGRDDTHFLIYGRYNDAVLWPVVAIGAAWLVRAARSRSISTVRALSATLMSLGLAGGLALWLFQTRLDEGLGVRAMVPGLLPYLGDRASVSVASVTTAAIIILIVVALSSVVHLGKVPLIVIVAPILLLTATVVTRDGLVNRVNFYQSTREVRAVADLVPVGETLGYHFVPADEPSWVLDTTQRRAYQLYQYYLDDHEIVPDEGTEDDVGPFVFAPREDPVMTASGAQVVWESTDVGMVLWLEP